ncbi:chaplin [Embleya sp. NPDC005575]|uniref:chaplin n=1 Tax=Embleya sp. NPDC005575 TaxID=3156892 RepID=UPI0033B30B8B
MNKLTKGAVATAAILGGSVAMGGQAFASADANGAAVDSPGVLSGNNIQVPVHVPVNLCGNSVDIIAALNPTFGNSCVNGDVGEQATPMTPGHPDHTAPPHHAAPGDDCGQEQQRQPHHSQGDLSEPTDFLAGAANMAGAMMG